MICEKCGTDLEGKPAYQTRYGYVENGEFHPEEDVSYLCEKCAREKSDSAVCEVQKLTQIPLSKPIRMGELPKFEELWQTVKTDASIKDGIKSLNKFKTFNPDHNYRLVKVLNSK